MTTPLLPTRIALIETTYTPQQLRADTQIEVILTGNRGVAFIASLMKAYRSGEVTSISHSFATREDALAIAQAIGLGTAYNYTVTGPGENPGDRTITVSWA